MVNVAKLEATMTHILDHPEDWNQRQWLCGTTACFAGRTLLNEGYSMHLGNDVYTWAVEPGEHFYPWAEGRYIDTWQAHGHQAKRVPVPQKAAHLLELSDEDAKVLFDSDCSLDNLREMCKDLANGESLDDWVDRGYDWVRRHDE